MLPAFMKNDSRNISLIYSKAFRYGDLRHAFLVEFADFYDLRFRQSNVAICFALCLTIFGNFIGCVLGIRAQKQVLRIPAAPIVAFVANKQSIRYFAMMKLIGHAMHLMFCTAVAESCVAAALDTLGTFPAFAGLTGRHYRPELCRQGNGCASVIHYITQRLAFAMSVLGIILASDTRLLPASALAFAIGRNKPVSSYPRRAFAYVFGKVWGMISVHKNLHFLCQAWDARNVARHFLLGVTGVIIAYLVELGNLDSYSAQLAAKYAELGGAA